MDTLILKSIDEEAADCRAAFAGVPVGALVIHLHHRELVEVLDEPVENRITYILTHKPEYERALRLRLFRPIPAAHLTPELVAAFPRFKAACTQWNMRKAARLAWCVACDEFDAAIDEWDASEHHAAICPGCPWDGSTIFPPIDEED